VLGALLAGLALQQACAGDGAGVDLPPLAMVEQRNGTNGGWRIMGRLPGSVAVAQQDFAAVLARQGWRLDKRIPMGAAARPSELCLWKKKGDVMLLMVWEREVGMSGFSIGWEDVAEAGRRKAAATAHEINKTGRESQ
jgi:hypothetical protein